MMDVQQKDQRPDVVLKALFENLEKAIKEGDKVAQHIKTCAADRLDVASHLLFTARTAGNVQLLWR